MAKVFVSYSRKDIEFAKRLTAELKKCELDFWIDWEGIPPTVDWWGEIEKGIEEADVFLFLISPDSSASKVCGQEIDTAVKNAKRIIPLVVRDIKGDEALKQLSHLNWIFFRQSDDFEAAFQKLLTGIHTDYEWVQQHRWLQVRALDWQRDNKDNSSLLRGKDLQDVEYQLATNSSKEPHPTDLQRQFVFASRKAVDRQRRILMSVSIVGIIALSFLALFAFYQARQARTAQAHAINNVIISQALQLGFLSPSLKNAHKSLQAVRLKDIAETALLGAQNSQLSLDLLNNPDYSSLAISTDGRYLAMVLLDQIAIWDATNLSADPIVLAAKTIVTSPIIFIDNRTLASGEDTEIVFWNVETKTVISKIPIETPYLTLFSFNANGNLLVAASRDGYVYVIKADHPSSPKMISEFKSALNTTSIAISPDGAEIATASLFAGLLLWDSAGLDFRRLKVPSSNNNPEEFNLEERNFTDIGFTPKKDKFIAVRTKDILVYDASSNFEVNPFILKLDNASLPSFGDMKFNPAGDQLAVGADNGSVYIWDLDQLTRAPRVIENLNDFSQIDWLR